MTTRDEPSPSGASCNTARLSAFPQTMKSAADRNADWLEQAIKTRELALRRAGLVAGNGGQASAATLDGDALDSAYVVECQKLFELTRAMLNADR